MDKEIYEYFLEKAKDVKIEIITSPKYLDRFKTKEDIDKWYEMSKCVEENFKILFPEEEEEE